MAKPCPTIWAAVPVKAFHQAKSRLSAAIPGAVREGLARAMLNDVLTALRQSQRVSNTLVVTSDPAVSALAADMGVSVLHDRYCQGQSSAVEQALHELQARGCTAMLTVPGDLPLIQAREIDELCDLLEPQRDVIIVPAGNDGGTNAILCALPTSMKFHLGEDSFARHVHTAQSLNLRYAVAEIAGFRLDLDRPSDLEKFITDASDTQAYSFLKTLPSLDRLGGSVG